MIAIGEDDCRHMRVHFDESHGAIICPSSPSAGEAVSAVSIKSRIN